MALVEARDLVGYEAHGQGEDVRGLCVALHPARGVDAGPLESVPYPPVQVLVGCRVPAEFVCHPRGEVRGVCDVGGGDDVLRGLVVEVQPVAEAVRRPQQAVAVLVQTGPARPPPTATRP
ncbi:hypothetical protein GCM10019016_013250 [Streptomyces prasinosporus]|uniref:Uncharacterized protein n=1 Tax=Streptomyces prasinosporus TaxID=68256 RepID=A0ABP6TG63_9ACTN